MNIITQYVQIKLSLTVAYARLDCNPEAFFQSRDSEIYNPGIHPGIQGSRRVHT